MKKIYGLALLFLLCQCSNLTPSIPKDTSPIKNGGLIIPDGFQATVFADSLGPSRHLAVNNNGDVYVKLSTDKGTLGNVALRDINQDGIADSIQRFGITLTMVGLLLKCEFIRGICILVLS